MSPSQHRVLDPAPWNRDKLVGPKPPLKLQEVWGSESGCNLLTGAATSSCSIWRSTASFGAAISCAYASVTSLTRVRSPRELS